MMWERILELERRIEELAARLARAEALATQNGQSLASVWSDRSGGGGGRTFCCQETVGAGTAPGGGSPATTTTEVFEIIAGTYVSVGTQTICNAMQDATDGSKTQILTLNGDGTYTVVAESCT